VFQFDEMIFLCFVAASDTLGDVAGKLGDSVGELGEAGAKVGHGVDKVGKKYCFF